MRSPARNPYPSRIGGIEPDAHADLLLIEGNPLADIKLVTNPEKNFHLIMKEGRLYKKALA